MNDNDFKILFKNSEEQVNPDFTDSLMKSINAKKAPSRVLLSSKFRVLNILIPAITVVSVIVYAIINPNMPESAFSKFMASVWDKLSSNLACSVDLSEMKNLIFFTIFILIVATVWDKLFRALFKK